jgi:hypothetical protein
MQLCIFHKLESGKDYVFLHRFDTCTKEVTVDDQKYNLGLWDSAGDKLYDEIRPISYPHVMNLACLLSLILQTHNLILKMHGLLCIFYPD